MLPAPRLAAATLLLCACFGNAGAAAPSTIPLHFGSNLIDFGGPGTTGMALLGRRDNFNAHGFDVLTLYLKSTAPNTAGVDADADWQVVTIFDGDKEALTLTTGGGADCRLHDFRLLRQPAPGDASLIVAQRDFSLSYVEPAPVHFKFYALRRNDAGDVGRPRYYFDLVKQTTSQKPYCDVGEAFAHELGVKAYRH